MAMGWAAGGGRCCRHWPRVLNRGRLANPWGTQKMFGSCLMTDQAWWMGRGESGAAGATGSLKGDMLEEKLGRELGRVGALLAGGNCFWPRALGGLRCQWERAMASLIALPNSQGT
jgi:hypothetical protein